MDSNNLAPPAPVPAAEPAAIPPATPQPTQTANTIPPTSTAPQAIVTGAGGENKSKMWMIIVMVVIIVILVGVGAYLYMNKETAGTTPAAETQSVVTQTPAPSVEDLEQELDAAAAADAANDMSEADQGLQGL